MPFAACNLRLSFKKQRGKAVFKMQRFAKSRNVEFGPTTASSGPWQGHHGPRRRGQGGSWRRPHRSHGKPPFLPRLHLWRKLLSGASRSKPGTDGVTERGKAELCLGCFLFSRSHGPPGEPSSPPPTPPCPSVRLHSVRPGPVPLGGSCPGGSRALGAAGRGHRAVVFSGKVPCVDVWVHVGAAPRAPQRGAPACPRP